MWIERAEFVADGVQCEQNIVVQATEAEKGNGMHWDIYKRIISGFGDRDHESMSNICSGILQREENNKN